MASLNQPLFPTHIPSLKTNLTSGSVPIHGFSLSCLNTRAPNCRTKNMVIKASVAVEQEAQTKVALIRIGTRGRYRCLFYHILFSVGCGFIPLIGALNSHTYSIRILCS